MAKMKDSTLLILGAIVVVIVLAVVFGGKPQSVGPTPTTTTIPASGLSCPNPPVKGLPSLSFSYSYPNLAQNGNPTRVAVPYNAFILGQSTPFSAGATSATALTIYNGTPITCPSTIVLVLGADGGNYGQQVFQIPVTNSTPSFVYNKGALMAQLAVPTFSNGTSFNTNTVTQGGPAGGLAVAGGTYRFTMNVNPGAGAYGVGGGILLAVAYNTVAVSSISIGGLPTTSAAFTYPSTVPAGYTVKEFLAPTIFNWTSGLVSYIVTITTGSGFTANTALAFYQDDFVNFLQPGISGSANGYTISVLQNPNTAADLGYAVTNSMVASNPGGVPGFGTNTLGGAIKLCIQAGCS